MKTCPKRLSGHRVASYHGDLGTVKTLPTVKREVRRRLNRAVRGRSCSSARAGSGAPRHSASAPDRLGRPSGPTGRTCYAKRNNRGNRRAYRRGAERAPRPSGRTGCMWFGTSRGRREPLRRHRRLRHQRSFHRRPRPRRAGPCVPPGIRDSGSACSESLCSRRTVALRN